MTARGGKKPHANERFAKALRVSTESVKGRMGAENEDCDAREQAEERWARTCNEKEREQNERETMTTSINSMVRQRSKAVAKSHQRGTGDERPRSQADVDKVELVTVGMTNPIRHDDRRTYRATWATRAGRSTSWARPCLPAGRRGETKGGCWQCLRKRRLTDVSQISAAPVRDRKRPGLLAWLQITARS